ncbi:methyltransferase [Nonomuraea insulae]|uniref:Methyltransferase n=1 Tax=Nonomuraea insulae TaxID=1616787 RepID=A0ABW1CRA2_9ACTN
MSGPEAVLRIASGARAAQVLFSAVELGVFTALSAEPLSADELAGKLGLHPAAVRDLLSALAALGLLARESGRYRPAEAAETYLVAGRPDYLGGFLAFLDGALHPAWRGLTESLRTGRPVRPGDPYGSLYTDPAERDGFLNAMDVLNRPIGAALARLGGWRLAGSFVDVGGARGNLAAQLVRAHPGLEATVFDLPALRPAFDAHMAALGLGTRVRFEPGDFFAGPLPEADALIFGHVLHNWPVERRRELLRKAHDALRPGGRVLVYDPMTDERRPRLPIALASLNMLVWSDGGAEYPVGDLRGWLFEAGFASVTTGPLTPSSTLVVARKAPR